MCLLQRSEICVPFHPPAKGSLADGTTCVASAEGNSGWACCNCGVGSADVLKGVEVAVAVEEVFDRRESEYILLVGSRKPPANGINLRNFSLQIQMRLQQ